MLRNPWEDEPGNVARAAKAVIRTARSRILKSREALPGLRSDIDDFLEDLAVIEDYYDADPAAYRKNRPLTAVHLPAIVSSLEGVGELGQRGLEDGKFSELQDELRGCLTAARHVRKTLETDAARPLEAEIEVVKDQLPDARGDGEADQPSRWAQMGSRVSGSIGTALKPVRDRLPDAPDIGGFYDQVTQRAIGGTEVARTYAMGLIEEGFDRVSSPVVAQVSAVQNALVSGSVSALVAGGITALVFPPAVPVVAGLYFLGDGGEKYVADLEKNGKKAEANRSKRRQEREREMQRSLARFAGKSPVVRMETPNVHVQMNLETNAASGMILAGHYAGTALEDLSGREIALLSRTAPDTETRDILHAWETRSAS
ncbi:hypothetical protein [Salipiger mucosus]|uniref:Uncharacterized protein n=1 Tax=Salipiger mucosus DSM 16094 TaxID=1123237 RepID=S9RS10_9RHOB|nr:hypothetical protein [Salipiger mucosus]EPX76759.1 hypothetical protein Salmuc_04645 [Salipiger mucosus DSM 16094]